MLSRRIRHRQNLGNEKMGELHPVLSRVYGHRAMQKDDDLSHPLKRLLSFDGLLNINAARELLAKVLIDRKKVLVIGDFDVDGATSCAVAIRALKLMGFTNVDYLVPNRFEYGYGLSPEIVIEAYKKNPDLIVTVDNGISSVDGVKKAKQLGIKVIVTDHHLPPQELPDADVIVNPNQKGDEFQSKNMAGVGVIFYVMLALRAFLKDQGWFEKQGLPCPNLAQLLDLVALGTVADVVPLDYNNRILVAKGLERIRNGQACEGIEALLRVSGRDMRRIVSSDMGFAIAPRLNAAGRLENMSIGVVCLLSDDKKASLGLAEQLDKINKDRRHIESEMRRQADEIIGSHDFSLGDKVGLSLYHDDFHQGVVGILASRLKEKFNRPVIVWAPDGSDLIKGSARSIPGLHLKHSIESIASEFPDLILKFGGHAMAAGLTIEKKNLPTFSKVFDLCVKEQLSEEDLAGYLYTDGALSGEDLSLEVAELLRYAGPWGQGFPEPTFDGTFDVMKQKVVGQKHLKLSLSERNSGQMIDAIAFNVEESMLNCVKEAVSIIYKLDCNEFMGRKTPQLIVEYMELVD